jgi:methyltransferase-like protein 6
MESRTDQSSLASTSTSVPPQSETPIASSSTDSKPTRTSKAKKPRIVLQGTPDEILDRNAARSASPAFVEKLVARAGTHWNKFYSNHAKNPATNQFFKDRHWTDREWPQLAQLAEPVDPKGKGKAVLEVGCGTGAFIYPYRRLLPVCFR